MGFFEQGRLKCFHFWFSMARIYWNQWQTKQHSNKLALVRMHAIMLIFNQSNLYLYLTDGSIIVAVFKSYISTIATTTPALHCKRNNTNTFKNDLCVYRRIYALSVYVILDAAVTVFQTLYIHIHISIYTLTHAYSKHMWKSAFAVYRTRSA